jgi:hypothetical protein
MGDPSRLTSNEVEAANRAEATALLIREGYRVYRPEADCYGEDLVLRTPAGELLAVQLKSRPTVDGKRYGGGPIWMLFPDPKGKAGRAWFLVPHKELYGWFETRHGRANKWDGTWSDPHVSRDLRSFLARYLLNRARTHRI